MWLGFKGDTCKVSKGDMGDKEAIGSPSRIGHQAPARIGLVGNVGDIKRNPTIQ